MSGNVELVPDWRRIFDNIRVAWRDRGANTGPNRLVIKCPFCRDDPGEHMSIATNALVYRCFRNNQHVGGHRGGAVKLLIQLGISLNDANRLLDNNSSIVAVGERLPPTGIAPSRAIKQWDRFSPAVENGKLLSYLRDVRGFPNPEAVCIRYNLRFAPHGEWAGRVLFPLIDTNGEILSWVGRAFFEHLKPKYRLQDVANQSGLIYVGRSTRRVSIIVEGPMDALKINAACEHLQISAAAVTGLAVPGWISPEPDRLLRIRSFLESAEIRLIALDNTVIDSQVGQIIKTLVRFQPMEYIINHLQMPDGGSDPGAMSYMEVRQWITEYLDTRGNKQNGATQLNTVRTYSP